MKRVYLVVATLNRTIKTSTDYKTITNEGYVTYSSYIKATSANNAIETAKSYYIPPGTKYSQIRATPADELKKD